MARRGFLALLATSLGVTGCGGAPESSEPATLAPPVTAANSAGLPSSDCNLGVLAGSSIVLVVSAVEGPVTVGEEPGYPGVRATIDRFVDTLWLGPPPTQETPAPIAIPSGFGSLDVGTLIEAVPTDRAPLYVFAQQHDPRGPYYGLVAAQQSADGLTMLGPCAAAWQPAVESAARTVGRPLDLDFLVSLTDWAGPEVEAVVTARGVPLAAVWRSTPPHERSLDYRDVPREYQNLFSLTALDVDSKVDVAGYVRLVCDDGVLTTFSSEFSGVLPVMAPLADSDVEIRFSADPSFREFVMIGSARSAVLDADLGARISVEGVSGIVKASVSTLAPGEIENLLGIGREELIAQREALLQSVSD